MKRSLYVFQRRSLSLPILQTLDAPALDASCERRRTSITPLQALSLYDGDFVNEEARYLAAQVRDQGGVQRGSQIRRAFQLALSRSPSAEESARVMEFLADAASEQEGLVGLFRVLLNSNEFVYVN